MSATTVLGAFLELAHADADAPAAMDKRLGVWQRRTRGDLAARVAATAAGLAELGVGPGSTVLVAAADQLEWLRVDLAVQATGARVCAVTADAPEQVLLRVARASGARVAVVTGQEAVDRVLDLIDGGSVALEQVIQQRPSGGGAVRDPRVVTLDDVHARGASAGGDRAWLDARVDGLRAEDAAVFAVSSGTVAAPHTVELTHGALLAGSRAVIEAAGLTAEDRVLSYRPLADPTERTTTIYASLVSGALLALPERRDQVAEAMYEVAPTVVHTTRRWLDHTASEVTSRLGSSRGLKALASRRWVRRLSGEDDTAPAGPLLRYPVVEKLGLDKVRMLIVSGSALGESEHRFAEALRLPVRTAYSLTEAGGIVTLSEADGAAAGCGRPLPGVDLTTDEDGQVVVAGPAISGGRFETGDLGDIIDGRLVLRGRRDEALATADGTTSLLHLETALRRSSYVREAVADPNGSAVTVTVELVEQAVVRWATAAGITFGTYRALANTDEVRSLVRGEVEPLAAEAGLPRIDELRILPVPLEDVPGALTPSGRIRREVVVAAGLTAGSSGRPAPVA